MQPGFSYLTVGVSGNAKQRRLLVRRWKKLGYMVLPFRPG
jgi:hypothetical protein